jgi:hypothetical protein
MAAAKAEMADSSCASGEGSCPMSLASTGKKGSCCAEGEKTETVATSSETTEDAEAKPCGCEKDCTCCESKSEVKAESTVEKKN